jgi:hypothetical protein
MAGALKHFLPSDHPETNWDEVVKCIPKEENAYDTQIEFLKSAFGDRTIGRILDVGAGEGSFTKTICDLLRKASLLADDWILDVIEKENEFVEELQVKIAHAKRIEIPSKRSPALPEDSPSLIDAIDSISQTQHVSYDLIIASHVSYYFDNAGATLAYGLASRLLSNDGLVWIIARDRSCGLYQAREAILLREELPDVNRQSFSDSLIDRLSCLYELDADRPIPKMALKKRSSSLNIPSEEKKQQILFEYLLWMENLPNEHLVFLSKLAGNMFSESHIFIHSIDKIPKQFELDSLSRIDVASDCIDVIRRVSQDVRVHRVSLANVKPSSMPTVKKQARAEPNMPSLMPDAFWLSSVGFAYYPDSHAEDTVLSNFFSANTSFLFYPRFYNEHFAQVRNGDSYVQKDFSIIRKLKGSPKVQLDQEYKIRKIPEFDRLSSSKSTTDSESGEGSKPLSISFDEWVGALENVYQGGSNSGIGTWTLCIGATVASDASHPFDDHQLNECCGLFLTVSSSEDLDVVCQKIVPHIRIRLTQWLGHSFYTEAKRRHEELAKQKTEFEKQAQMLMNIRIPLQGISDALSTMQSNSQVVRAVLYEPEEALFASHAEVAPFFITGESSLFRMAGISDFCIQHDPEHYRDERDLKLVIGGLMCGVLVGTKDLTSKTSEEDIYVCAVESLNGAEDNPTMRAIAAHLKEVIFYQNDFLEEIENSKKYSGLSSLCDWSSSDTAVDLWKSACRTAISNIKSTLYSPFKPETSLWTSLAFDLLVKNSVFDGLTPSKRTTVDLDFQSDPTPVSFAAVLAFLRDVTVALKSKKRKLTTFTVSGDRDKGLKFISLGWNCSILANRPYVDQTFIRNMVSRVIFSPRDWRVESVNYGDLVRPFVMLANKMMGLHEDNGWRPIRCKNGDCIIIVRQTKGGVTWEFRVKAEEQTIQLIWEKID